MKLKLSKRILITVLGFILSGLSIIITGCPSAEYGITTTNSVEAMYGISVNTKIQKK